MTGLFAIGAQPLDIAALAAAMQQQSAGAFVSFEGWVRDHNEGKQVTCLEYEVFHALALSEGERIVQDAIARFGLIAARCVHREGVLQISDCAVWVGVVSAHRGEAFAACRAIIDAIKHRLPIWKKETYADGLSEWVNCRHQGEHTHAHQPHQPALTDNAYYNRQIKLPEIGTEGQRKLTNAKVLIVGAGGLGSSAALSLAAAGIGTIGIIEHDRLEASNLHRQLIYNAADIGQPKAELAASALRRHNPLINVIAHQTRLNAANTPDLLATYDIILDCTDNFATKYLLNDAAILLGKPVIQASIYRFEGHILTLAPNSEGGCLRCLWPLPPEAGEVGDCAETGVLGTVPALFGTLQANEAIKRILQLGDQASTTLFTFNLLTLQSRSMARQRRKDCALCGEAPTITKLANAPLSKLELNLHDQENPAEILRQFRLIDLRENDEKTAPLPNAYALPFSHFKPDILPFSHDTPLLLICAQGRRSVKAADLLNKAGWKKVFSLQGGVASLPPEHEAA